MAFPIESSDASLVELLRRRGPLGISELADAMQVTPTAVRQRLTRLTAQGHIERTMTRGGRGRPSHRYALTKQGARSAGDNFADLASVLWEEIRSLPDPEVRRGLLRRLADRLARRYREQVGGSAANRFGQMAELLAEREVSCETSKNGEFPVLKMYSCPYPELAEQDRGVCAMETMLMSELAGVGVELSECRLDGAACCAFQAK